MPRQVRAERRHLHHASRFTLILAILVSPGSARIAASAAPAFQSTFTSPGLCSPRGIGLSPSGDVFVGSDCQSQHMERFTAAGGLLGTWAFPAGFLGSPNGVALDGSGNVYVTDYTRNRVNKFTSSGTLLTAWDCSGSQPVDIAADGTGNVFVVELGGRQVEKFTAGGSYLATIGSAGTGQGQFQEPIGIGLDASGRLYVADAGRVRILRFLANGSFDMEFTPPGAPYDVAVGPDGNLYVLHFAISAVYQYSPSGVQLLSFGSPNGLNGAFRIAISPTGAIFITEQHTNRVTRFQIDQATGAKHLTFGGLKALYR